MKRIITGGHHFGHANIIKYTGRPFKDVDEMDREMISRWNSLVTNDDIVYHTGDFAFGRCKKTDKVEKYWNQLNGKLLILIKGNHDRYNFRRADEIVMVRDRVMLGNLILTHKPLSKVHIPKGFINIHAHIHEKLSPTDRHFNISVEHNDYFPYFLEDVKRRIEEAGRAETA